MSIPPLIRVLLVDDCPTNIDKTCELLLNWRIRPTIAVDGMRAVNIVSTQEFDVILMDISMPVMDGLEATSHIRQFERLHPRRPRQVIIAYTSGGTCDERELWRNIGIDAILEKPCDIETLEACLIRWCTNFDKANALGKVSKTHPAND